MKLPRVRLMWIASVAFALAGAGAARATELRMLTSWTPTYAGVPQLAERFANKVSEHSGGTLDFVITGPEAVPAFEQLAPVALGIFDLLFTHGAYHFDATGMGLALDAVSATPAELRASGVWAAIDRHYRALGLKLIALPASRAGYQLWLREPIGQSCDLAGRKVRGSPLYHGLLEALGAVPVALPAGEIHAALEKKIVDGAAWPAVGAIEYEWHEVSRYLLRPTFGSVTHLLLMNLESWNALAPDAQALLLAEGGKLEEKSLTRFKKLATREENELKVLGMQTTELCGEALAGLPHHWADGVWRRAIEKSGDAARALRETARAAGLTH